MKYKVLDKLIIETLQEHFRQGFEVMQIEDIKEDIKAEIDIAIRRIFKKGEAYTPRKGLIKLTKPPVETGGFG